MKCAACSFEKSENEFGSNIFLSIQVYTDEDNKRFTSISGDPVRVFSCPKCGTLKIRTKEDENNEKNF
jgi:hypothetical protein